jgi:protein phosphatase
MFRYSAITDKGIRSSNEDRVLVSDVILGTGYIDGMAESCLLAVVCDGVGGESFGAEAAQLAVETISKLPQIKTHDEAIDAVEKVNTAVLTAQRKDEAHSRMSCTLAGISVMEDNVVIFNVGDSKVYRFREPYIAQISVDHTFAKEAMQIGMVSDKSQLTESNQHRITRCIGEEIEWTPDVYKGKHRKGDIYLLCSDGLSDVVNEDELEKVLSQSVSPETKCRQLLSLATMFNSRDNISIIILEV